ncbi:MAG: hypothetical protein ACTSWY_06265 [Promethearchaeota archaeon]
MSEKGFIPLSNQLGIPGSSYRVQLGKVNKKWAVRLAKGSEVLDSKVFHDLMDPDGTNPPNANTIVGWVLQVLPIPNLNPYQIVKSVGFIRQEAIRQAAKAKKKPQVSIKEAKEVKLAAIPEDVQKKRPKSVGWVKEGSTSTSNATEDNRKSCKRILPKIPGGDATAVAIEGIKCGSCGNVVKFCPYCGKPLKSH